MTRNPEDGRRLEEIRASNIRLGLLLLAIVVAFFVGIFIKQWFFA